MTIVVLWSVLLMNFQADVIAKLMLKYLETGKERVYLKIMSNITHSQCFWKHVGR